MPVSTAWRTGSRPAPNAKKGVFGYPGLAGAMCRGSFSDRRHFNGMSPRYFFGCDWGTGGASLLGGTMFFSRMYVTRLP